MSCLEKCLVCGGEITDDKELGQSHCDCMDVAIDKRPKIQKAFSDASVMRERAEKAEAELAEMKRKYKFTYCAYCGATFEIDAPESTDAVSEHIKTCAAHPMRIVEAELGELRQALTMEKDYRRVAEADLARVRECLRECMQMLYLESCGAAKRDARWARWEQVRDEGACQQ